MRVIIRPQSMSNDANIGKCISPFPTQFMQFQYNAVIFYVVNTYFNLRQVTILHTVAAICVVTMSKCHSKLDLQKNLQTIMKLCLKLH